MQFEINTTDLELLKEAYLNVWKNRNSQINDMAKANIPPTVEVIKETDAILERAVLIGNTLEKFKAARGVNESPTTES